MDITGAKCMIGNSDLQFTNATQLNDPFDCHPSLLDYESMVDENLQGIRKQWQKEEYNYNVQNTQNKELRKEWELQKVVKLRN